MVNPSRDQSRIALALNNLDSPGIYDEIASWPNSWKATAIDDALSRSDDRALQTLLERTDNADLSSIIRKRGHNGDFYSVIKISPHGNAKSLDEAFKLFPLSVNDPKYLDALFKSLKQNPRIPGGDLVAFQNLKTIISQESKSGLNTGQLVETVKVFMKNMDYMNGPATTSYFSKKYPDTITGILTNIRNVKGIDKNPAIVHELDRALIYFSYLTQGKVYGTFDSLVRMDSPEMNNRLLVEAAKRGDTKVIGYFKTLDASKFGLDWNSAKEVATRYRHSNIIE